MRKGFAFIAMIAIILSNVMVHADKPYANFVFSPEYPKVNESVTFNASSSHAVNATLVNYTWDFGDGSIAYGRVVTHAYKSEGIYRVCLRVVDNKSMNSTICKNITVDSTPPTIKYDLIPSSPNGKNGWYITKVKMEIKAKDALSGIKEVRYKIDEGVWKNYSGTIYINNEGNHFIYFYAMDKGGNTDEGAITFKIDFTPPSTQFHVNKNATNGWYDEDVNVTLAAYDTLSGIDSIHYLLDNKLYDYNGEIKIGEGNHSFIYYSTDKAGNIEELKRTRIKIDKHAPDVTLLNPTDGIYLFGRKLLESPYPIIIGNVSIEVKVIDELSGVAHVDFYIDDELKFKDDEPPYSWEWNEQMIGVRDIQIVAYDKAGNHASVEKSVIVVNL